MASICQSARAVHVIDAEIEQVQVLQSDTDFLAYVLCSAWNSRCWTYQEAVLGKRLFFKTKSKRKELRIGDGLLQTDNRSVQSRWLIWC